MQNTMKFNITAIFSVDDAQAKDIEDKIALILTQAANGKGVTCIEVVEVSHTE